MLKNCADSHDKVYFESDECPACVFRLQLDETMDAKVDISDENIFKLFDNDEAMDKRLKAIEYKLGIRKRSLFRR